MNSAIAPSVRIRRLWVDDYKGIDHIELAFPPPLLPGDPDIVVMGSRNGLGKTSVLECCALLLIGLTRGEYLFELERNRYLPMDLPQLMIRAGASLATIGGELVIGGEAIELEMTVHSSGAVKIKNDPEQLQDVQRRLGGEPSDLSQRFVGTLCGTRPDPLLARQFLYFHSYRKVQEGNPELGMMVEPDSRMHRMRMRPGTEMPMSSFKLTLLRALMSRADLFEDIGNEQSEEVLTVLNELVKRYAGGSIGKLRPSPDNTVDFRIQPLDGGPSYTFDGLSSGQKEMIATLFLIWYQTRNRPAVVLIDEPELHLNPEWHRDFFRRLAALAPGNQYIVATHSEDVFASVDEDRRLLLSRPAGPPDD